MKKHIILTILSVAAIFASCNNGFEPKPVLPEGNGLILSLDSRPMVTKADDAPVLPAYETAIDHFDFFFFDDEEGTTPTTGMHARVSGASTQLATGTGEAYAALRDGTHYVYILANYPDEIDHTSDWKLDDILALEFESKIVKEKKTEVNPVTGKVEETGEVVFCDNLVMDSFNETSGKYTVELTPTTIQEEREVTVGLSRIAAKMFLTLNIESSVPGNLDEEVWTPILKDIQAYYVNALNNKATVGAKPVNRAKLDDESSYEYLTYPSAYKLTKSEDSDYTYTMDPIYTYPQEWEAGNNGEPYFKVFLPWMSTKKGSSNFYYKIVVPKPDSGNTWTINRNTAYNVTATLSVVDSQGDYILLEGGYTIYPWPAIGHEGGGPMAAAKFFDVPIREFTLYSKESISIPFSSSSAVSAYFTEVSYWYYGSTNGTHYHFRFDPADEEDNVSLPTDKDSDNQTLKVKDFDGNWTNAAKDLNPYSLTLDGKFIRFDHTLTDIYSVRTINLVIKNADGRSANVTITQHPAIEIKAHPSKNAFLDGYYNLGEETVRDAEGNLTGHKFTATGNPYMTDRDYWRSGTTWNSQSNLTGQNNFGSLYAGGSTSVKADHFFLTEVSVSAFTEQNNKYKVRSGSSTGTLIQKEYRIGDPRVPASKYYNSSSFKLPNYLYSDKAKRTKNDDGTYTETTDPAGDVTYEWEEPLKILIGSQSESDRNVIAPRLLVSSHMNITDGVNWNTSGGKGIVQRCAMYQEAGYPAGRWRLPTEAEFAFMMKLQADGVLPGLFAKCYYRMADGRGIYIGSAGDYPYTNDATNPSGSTKYYIRMVYDLWYWGDDPTEGVEKIRTPEMMTPWELANDPVTGEPNWKVYWAEYYHPNMHER